MTGHDPLLAALGVSAESVAELITALGERQQTLATAESITAGLLSAVLTATPGSSVAVRGGLVVYATDLKHELAGVPAPLLSQHGAVHPEVAEQLAIGARKTCSATWGLGLTGVAGPDPQDGVLPGRVYVALDGPPGCVVHTLDLAGSRAEIRAASVRATLDLVRAATAPIG